MKTIYARDSFNVYNDTCTAIDTIKRALYEAGNIGYQEHLPTDAMNHRIVTNDGLLEIIILNTEESSYQDQIVYTQGSLFFRIMNFYNTLDNIKHERFNKIFDVISLNDETIKFRVGVDFCTYEDDYGDEYQAIDDFTIFDLDFDCFYCAVSKRIGELWEANDFDKFMSIETIEIGE